MATFGLVHGVCAGAWSWAAVQPLLEEAGHRVVAVDLPCDDPQAKFSDYATVVEKALADAGDDVVLVGHSTGGQTIPLVAARRPVRELVYLCATVPEPGFSIAERGVDWRAVDQEEWAVDNGDGSFSISPDGFRRHVAPELDPDAAEQAVALLRPQFLTPFTERCPLNALPDAPRRYILCRDDHLVSPDYGRRVAPERLGVEPIELPGSHSPMAGRPGELTELLLAGIAG
jgi:pimeloyl-ACP methyl ester carboxylesterase